MPRSAPSITPDRTLARSLKASKVPAVSRAAAVMRLLGRADQPMGIHAIARMLDIVPSTCFHILRALTAEELVAFDQDTKRYSLDAGVLTLARHWLRRNRFADIAQPVLDAIADGHGVTAMGVRLVGLDHMTVVALSQSSRPFHLSTQIGSRFPALISATGRCIAAFGSHPREEIEPRFQTLLWDNPPSLDQWREEIEATRAQGYAVDAGHYISGVTIWAAPIFGLGDRMDHAIVAVGIGKIATGPGAKAVGRTLLKGATAVSRQLSGGDEAAVPSGKEHRRRA